MDVHVLFWSHSYKGVALLTPYWTWGLDRKCDDFGRFSMLIKEGFAKINPGLFSRIGQLSDSMINRSRHETTISKWIKNDRGMNYEHSLGFKQQQTFSILNLSTSQSVFMWKHSPYNHIFVVIKTSWCCKHNRSHVIFYMGAQLHIQR